MGRRGDNETDRLMTFSKRVVMVYPLLTVDTEVVFFSSANRIGESRVTHKDLIVRR